MSFKTMIPHAKLQGRRPNSNGYRNETITVSQTVAKKKEGARTVQARLRISFGKDINEQMGLKKGGKLSVAIGEGDNRGQILVGAANDGFAIVKTGNSTCLCVSIPAPYNKNRTAHATPVEFNVTPDKHALLTLPKGLDGPQRGRSREISA